MDVNGVLQGVFITVQGVLGTAVAMGVLALIVFVFTKYPKLLGYFIGVGMGSAFGFISFYVLFLEKNPWIEEPYFSSVFAGSVLTGILFGIICVRLIHWLDS